VSGGGVAKTRAGASGSRWLTPCGCWLYCRSVEDCVEEMLRDYKREVEKMKGRLFTQPGGGASAYPGLEAFGADWVRACAPHVRGEVGGDCRGYAQVPVDGGGGEAE